MEPGLSWTPKIPGHFGLFSWEVRSAVRRLAENKFLCLRKRWRRKTKPWQRKLPPTGFFSPWNKQSNSVKYPLKNTHGVNPKKIPWQRCRERMTFVEERGRGAYFNSELTVLYVSSCLVSFVQGSGWCSAALKAPLEIFPLCFAVLPSTLVASSHYSFLCSSTSKVPARAELAVLCGFIVSRPKNRKASPLRQLFIISTLFWSTGALKRLAENKTFFACANGDDWKRNHGKESLLVTVFFSFALKQEKKGK